MRITNVECIPVQAPGRTLVIILVDTDEGITGIGEAGLQRRIRAISGAVEHLSRWLIGEDPMRIEHLWQKMFRGGFYPADKLIGSAISGIDIALWDIKGKVLGVPVYELLGGRCRDYVQCYMPNTYAFGGTPEMKIELDELRKMAYSSGDDDALAELAGRCCRMGHKFFGFGPFPSGNILESRKVVRRLVEQLRAVRSAVGDAMELIVDLHTEIDPSEAVWFCREIEPFNVFMVEDAIRSEYINGYRYIRQHVNIPLAAGEQWANKWEFRQAIEEDLINYARLDICISGGLTEARKIAGWAETHYIKIMPHNPLGPVCAAASLQLDIACGNAGPQEIGLIPEYTLPDVFKCSFRLEGSKMSIPEASGIGVSFDREAAAKYPGEMTEPPHYQREDGSYTNY